MEPTKQGIKRPAHKLSLFRLFVPTERIGPYPGLLFAADTSTHKCRVVVDSHTAFDLVQVYWYMRNSRQSSVSYSCFLLVGLFRNQYKVFKNSLICTQQKLVLPLSDEIRQVFNLYVVRSTEYRSERWNAVYYIHTRVSFKCFILFCASPLYL